MISYTQGKRFRPFGAWVNNFELVNAMTKKTSREKVEEATRQVSFDEIEKQYWAAAEKHPGPSFTRKELSRFLGGTPSTGRLANMDSEGTGPDGKFHDKGRTKYLKEPAIKWALRRVKVKP